MKKTSIILFVCVMALCLLSSRRSTSKEPLSTRILGGHTVRWNKKYPWFVRLSSEIGAKTCGGSLITKDCVLTAAHCIRPDEKPQNVRIGGLEVRKVRSVIVHPQYDKRENGKLVGNMNDIAIIILENPSVYPPVRLGRSKPAKNSTVTIIGKGFTRPITTPEMANDPVPPLQEARMSIETDAQRCPVVLWNGGSGLMDFICLVSDDKSACYGDSGGPAIQFKGTTPYVVGVTSGGIPTCDTFGGKYSALYTSVSHHMDWIERTVKRYSKYHLLG